jgi:hypothetical protein
MLGHGSIDAIAFVFALPGSGCKFEAGRVVFVIFLRARFAGCEYTLLCGPSPDKVEGKL